MGFCNDITPTCDVCFEVLYGECNDVLTISLGLTASTTFFLNLTDKFDIVTPLTITTDGNGDFTITQTWVEFFGDIEVTIFSDSGRTLVATFTQNSTVYDCVILTQELSGSNNIIPPSIFNNQFSMLFDGSNEYINSNSILTSLSGTSKGTWSLWVKPVDATPVSAEEFISFGDTDAANIIRLCNQGTGKLLALAQTGPGFRWILETDAVVFSDNVYTHVALVQDGVSPVIYINGVAIAQTFDGANSPNKAAWFSEANLSNIDNGLIAAFNFNGNGVLNNFNGNIDEPRFWNTNLSSAQIVSTFNLGTPLDPDFEPLQSNLVSSYRMGDKSAFDGTDFTLVDQSGSNNITSVNMEFSDKVSDVP